MSRRKPVAIRPPSLLIVLSVVLLMAGCTTPKVRPDPLAIGIIEYDDDEPLVIWLANDYGWLIEGDGTRPVVLYLYDKPRHRIDFFTDFPSFLAAVEMIPPGSRVDNETGCGMSHIMPDSDRMQLEQLTRRKRFRMTGPVEGNFPICTCESKQLRLLKKAK